MSAPSPRRSRPLAPSQPASTGEARCPPFAQRSPVLGLDGSLPQGDAKHDAVEGMFDRLAPRYDRMNRIISLGLDKGWRRRTVDALALSTGRRVLDLACGTGDLCRDLAARGYAPIGIDFSAGMLASAQVDTPLVRGDCAALPVPTASVDGITCGFALRNFVDLDAVFAECARVLRADGRFAALDATVPANPILRAGNAMWFHGAVPLLGRFVARDAEAYRYLPKSTAYLPSPADLAARLAAAGFRNVGHATLTGGSVLLLTGTRA